MAIDTTLLEALIAATPTPGGYWTADNLQEILDNLNDLETQIGAISASVTTDATLTGDGTATAALTVATPLPAITSSSDTLVLTVVSGATTATWTAPASGLPDITSSSDTLVLTVISGATTATWSLPASGLPDITSSSDTLVLTVVSGATTATWSLGTPGPKGDTGDTGATGGFNSVQTIKTVTGNYTLTIDEAGALVKATASAQITVPLNSSVAFDVGQHIDIVAWTSAAVTVAAISAGVTIREPFGDQIKTQYGAATLVKMASDEWLVIGDLEAASGIATGTTPIYVSGAGFSAVNQTYTWDSGDSRWIYGTSYKIHYYGGKWLLSNLSLAVDYYSNAGGDADTLPITGWVTESGGSAPAPTISDTAP